MALLNLDNNAPADDNMRYDPDCVVNEKVQESLTDFDDTAALAVDFRNNVLAHNHRSCFATQNNCFTGREAVDYIVQSRHLTRQEAVNLGRKLQLDGLFQHINDEYMFADSDHKYYRYTDVIDSPDDADANDDDDLTVSSDRSPLALTASSASSSPLSSHKKVTPIVESVGGGISAHLITSSPVGFECFTG